MSGYSGENEMSDVNLWIAPDHARWAEWDKDVEDGTLLGASTCASGPGAVSRGLLSSRGAGPTEDIET